MNLWPRIGKHLVTLLPLWRTYLDSSGGALSAESMLIVKETEPPEGNFSLNFSSLAVPLSRLSFKVAMSRSRWAMGRWGSSSELW